jgi:ABC-type polysaccharide/polyol phosphate export permease
MRPATGLVAKMVKRARAAVAAKTLLGIFVSRELKVRYKRTVLGFLWSLATPLAMAAVFTFIFTVVWHSPVPRFPMFFLAGFLPWSFFNASSMMSSGSIISNAALVKKASFPAELLPVATVIGNLAHFLAAVVVIGPIIAWPTFKLGVTIPLLLLAAVLLTMFCSGIALLLSALNVIYRDIQELIPVLFLVWFYATPVVYDLSFPSLARFRVFLLLNPMTAMVTMVRDALFWGVWPSPLLMGGAFVTAFATLIFGYAVFVSVSSRFAREL